MFTVVKSAVPLAYVIESITGEKKLGRIMKENCKRQIRVLSLKNNQEKNGSAMSNEKTLIFCIIIGSVKKLV